MTPSGVSGRLALLVRARAGNACEYCRLPQTWQEAEFHFDHIVPRCQGGSVSAENLALACVGCSLKKGARQEARDPETLRIVRLFDPRKDIFAEHFAWTAQWRLKGLTATGRATVAALDLNRARLLEIRRNLAKHGQFDGT